MRSLSLSDFLKINGVYPKTETSRKFLEFYEWAEKNGKQLIIEGTFRGEIAKARHVIREFEKFKAK